MKVFLNVMGGFYETRLWYECLLTQPSAQFEGRAVDSGGVKTLRVNGTPNQWNASAPTTYPSLSTHTCARSILTS